MHGDVRTEKQAAMCFYDIYQFAIIKKDTPLVCLFYDGKYVQKLLTVIACCNFSAISSVARHGESTLHHDAGENVTGFLMGEEQIQRRYIQAL